MLQPRRLRGHATHSPPSAQAVYWGLWTRQLGREDYPALSSRVIHSSDNPVQQQSGTAFYMVFKQFFTWSSIPHSGSTLRHLSYCRRPSGIQQCLQGLNNQVDNPILWPYVTAIKRDTRSSRLLTECGTQGVRPIPMHRLPYSAWVTIRRHRPHYRYSRVCKQSVASCPMSMRHAQQEANNHRQDALSSAFHTRCWGRLARLIRDRRT